MENNEICEPRIIIQGFEEDSITYYISQLNTIINMFGPQQPILLEISTYGGSAFGAIRLIEALNSVTNNICTYCNSMAMSAGAIILAACGTPGLRFASPMAEIMIHEIQANAEGGVNRINNEVKQINKLNDKLMTLLAKNIGLKSSKDIKKLIRDNSDDNELYLNTDKALELGIIDKVCYLTLEPSTIFNIITEVDSRRDREDKFILEMKKEKNKEVQQPDDHFTDIVNSNNINDLEGE